MENTYLLHYGTIALAVGINSVGVGLGEGLASLAALKAIDIQPHARPEISKTFILGMALIETAAVVGLTISLMLLAPIKETASTEYIHYAELGIALAICIAGGVIGVASSFPAQHACFAVARQPFFSQKIQGLMLLTQSLMQTPIIFAFIVALFIKNQLITVTSAADSVRLLASGLCIGIGSIGPSIGLSLFSKEVCKGVGVNPYAYQRLLSFTLISEALIESPLIFALLISLILLQVDVGSTFSFINAAAFFSSALCMGLGTLGVGISSGQVAASACRQIALTPEHYSSISRTSLFGQILIETCSIYALIVSLALIFTR